MIKVKKMKKIWLTILVFASLLIGCANDRNSNQYEFSGVWACGNDTITYKESDDIDGISYGIAIIGTDENSPFPRISEEEIEIDTDGYIKWSNEHKFANYKNVLSVSNSELILTDLSVTSILECKKMTSQTTKWQI